MTTWPSCAAIDRQTKAGKNRCGTQRLQCRHCQRYHTEAPKKKGYPEATRTLALRMVVDGTNFRRTARLVGVCPQTVINWGTAACDALPVRPVPPAAAVVEMDELFSFVTHKKLRLRLHGGRPSHALCAGLVGECVLAWSVSLSREADTPQPLADQTAVLRPAHYFRDGYEVYRTLVYRQGQHEVAPGKSQTYSVEGDNAGLRPSLARLGRKSRCFSRSLVALARQVKLFVFCYSARQLFQQRFPGLKAHLIDFLPARI